jgi:hypothetical protein
VFASAVGTPLDPSYVRRDFRNAIRGRPGLNPGRLDTARAAPQLRLATLGQRTPIDKIARLVGHSSTAVTELVTASRSGRFSSRALWSWIASSGMSPMRTYLLT